MTGKFSKNFISSQKSILEVLNNKFWVVICVPKHTPHIPRHILSLFEGEGFRPKDLKNTFSDRRWPKCLLSWQICMTFEAQDSFMHAWQPRLFFYQKWAQKSKSENMRYILDLSCTIDSRWLYFFSCSMPNFIEMSQKSLMRARAFNFARNLANYQNS